MARQTLSAFYVSTKGAVLGAITEPGQSINNLARVNASEGTSYTFLTSFQLQSGNYFPAGINTDDTLRMSAYMASNPSDVAGGGDLKWRGNYIHPTASLVSINGVTKSGVLYYAGWNSGNGTTSIPFRTWIEILSTVNPVTGPIIAPNSLVTLVIEDGNNPA